LLFHQGSFLTIPALYMDPGTGSLLIQLILAALLGIGVAVRVFWKRIRTLFRAKNSSSLEMDEEEEDE
jgi:hypothetical protein